jgi:hypothetical protein
MVITVNIQIVIKSRTHNFYCRGNPNMQQYQVNIMSFWKIVVHFPPFHWKFPSYWKWVYCQSPKTYRFWEQCWLEISSHSKKNLQVCCVTWKSFCMYAISDILSYICSMYEIALTENNWSWDFDGFTHFHTPDWKSCFCFAI